MRPEVRAELPTDPSLLIMDEPTTALDVTVEAAVLDLIAELKERHKTATLYITHNLGVVARVSDRLAVMYAGEIVELAPTSEIFKNPLHPYTMGLLRCLPDVDAPKGTRTLYPIPGRVPSPANLPQGCIFAPRCEQAKGECSVDHPALIEIEPGHEVRCLRRAKDWDEVKRLWSIVEEKPTEVPSRLATGDAVLDVEEAKVYYSCAIPDRWRTVWFGEAQIRPCLG